jgi:hypothetical protein
MRVPGITPPCGGPSPARGPAKIRGEQTSGESR